MHEHPLTHAPTYTRSMRMHTTYARIHPSRAQVLLSNMKLLPVLLLLLLLLLQVACWHAAAAAASGKLACCHSCCCCMLLREIGSLSSSLNKHPEQSNPEEHFQRGFLLPVPPPFSLPARATSTASSKFPGSPECNIYLITGVPEPGVSDQ